MALLVSRIAGEVFGGASILPVPSPAQLISGVGVTPPASPGISPTLTGTDLGIASSGAPQAAPSIAPDSGQVSGVGVSPPGLTPPSSLAQGVGVSPPGSPGGLTPPIAPPSALPVAAPSSLPSSPPSSPFDAPIDFDRISHAPQLGQLGTPAAMPGMGALFQIPIVDATAIDAAPTYVPTWDTAPTRIEAAEQPPEHGPRRDDKLVRDLGGTAFDPYTVRKDFPILEEKVHGKRLVWLDNAATTQKPRAVIDRLSHFYAHENSNVHRAAHTLAARATDAYESARESARRFLNAPSTKEIVWVRGATEGINLIAQTYGRRHVGKGDEIVITHLEHHANIVPWQMLCAEKGARLRVAPVDDRGDVIVEQFERLLGPRTKLVSIPQVSNALGTITPTRQLIEIAHRYNAPVMVDGAQAVSHMAVDVQALDCEWYVFSGHKVFAPTGIGVVYGKREILAAMPPWQGGGNMIEDVTFENTRYQAPPWRFEAGTGSIGDAVGLGAALDYVMKIGMNVIDEYEHSLLEYGLSRLATVPGLTMVGTSKTKAGVMSFVLDGQRTEDVSAALDKDGIAVRSGHHCAQPILRRFGHEATVRASLAFYNVCEDIDALVEALHRLQAGRG
ncbi:MAG: SufS family cysteine desulfurase [Myxococcales bacterium]|nr:SufS family cysteine desulfurase [Myxococcales bacterium]